MAIRRPAVAGIERLCSLAMTSLIWITGASSGIGAALADTVPYSDARVFDISRRGGTSAEHVPADLSDPEAWAAVETHLVAQLAGFAGTRAVFLHCAATIEPIGAAGAVDSAAYRRAVLLNSGAPQALGHAFLRASAGFRGEKHLVMLSSGAARTPYEGWSTYGAGKAALDQWVRVAGAEQEHAEAPCRVVAVGPGVVATRMQEQIRAADEADFPNRDKFWQLYEHGQLRAPRDAAVDLWALLARPLDNGAVVDLRSLS